MHVMRTDRRVIILFMLPAMLLFFGVIAFPLIYTLVMSFTKWDVGGFRQFILFSNYTRMFTTDSVLGVAFKNTLAITDRKSVV